jgi:hypothetical protein
MADVYKSESPAVFNFRWQKRRLKANSILLYLREIQLNKKFFFQQIILDIRSPVK